MKYQKKPVIVDAVQWNKEKGLPGIHPDISAYSNRHNTTMKALCKACGYPMLIHGLMLPDITVCPGSWIVTEDGRQSYKVSQPDFERDFEIQAHEPGPVDAVTRMWHYYQEKYKILWPNHPERMKAAKIYECREIDFCDIMNGVKGHPEPRVYRSVSDWPSGRTRNKVNAVYAAVVKVQVFPPLNKGLDRFLVKAERVDKSDLEITETQSGGIRITSKEDEQAQGVWGVNRLTCSDGSEVIVSNITSGRAIGLDSPGYPDSDKKGD